MSISKDDKDFVNSISPSFCAAKWTQVTLDLLHGTNHSCHHPKRHNIPLEGLDKNPGRLHNTPFKKKVRKQMLQGKRPKECSYCWNVEDASCSNVSDRYIKTLDPWSRPYIDEVIESSFEKDFSPTYLEVFFSKTCNLSCAYCIADVSSSIEKEIRDYGPMPVSRSDHRCGEFYPKFKEENNPYIKAFWKWLPDIIRKLQVLRITGGEPLLDPNTYKLFDYIKEHEPLDLTFAVNSNMSLPQKVLNRFFENIDDIREHINDFELYVSVDTFADHSEYIRSGMNYELVLSNIKRFMTEFPSYNVVVMCCFNVLSISKFHLFLKDVLDLKRKGNLTLNISYLNDPPYLSPLIADKNLQEQTRNSLSFMEKNRQDLLGENGFSSFEVNSLKRICMLMETVEERKTVQARRDFFYFVNEFDKRKGTHFLETFPSLSEFYNSCENLTKFRYKVVNKIIDCFPSL